MGRLKLELPDRFGFSTELTVRVGDINYGQHLGNDAVLAFAHEARVCWLRDKGFCESNAGGAAMIMLDAVVVYRSQAKLGDVLRIEVAAGEIGPAGCDVFYRMTQSATGAEVARVKTGLAFFDYAANRVARTPDAFRAAFAPEA